jgi:hypothetical protein
MSDANDLLVQRFVDQDLSAEERVNLIARLGRDEPLRRRVLAFETMALESRRLPRPIVPEDFSANVVARIAGDRSPWAFVQRLLAPRTLQWNMASAFAAACLLVIAASAAFVAMRRPGAPTPAAAAGTAPTVLVRLVVLQPQARTVEVAGDFNGWDPARTPLEQTAGGAWTVTLPLEPGRYKYMFVVDGHEWVVDPFAVEQADDGFGSRNAVLDVRPASPRASS